MPAATNSVRAHGLHEGSDNAQAERSGNLKRLAAARRLEDLGTTAKREEWQGKSEWCADMEYVWRARLSDQRTSLAKRGKRLRAEAAALITERVFDGKRWRRKPAEQPPLCPLTAMHRVSLLRSAEWCDERARAMAMTRTDVVQTCRERTRVTTCNCTTREVRVGCDAPLLCTWCRKRHWRRWRKRITKALDARVRAARAEWNRHREGMLPGVYLITLTGPHSGDIATDRARMGRAVRSLLKYATSRNWWQHYALTWEVTPGTDGAGHVHCHMAVVSSWIPYTCAKGNAYGPREPFRDTYWVRKRWQRTPTMGLHEAWRRYMPGAEVLDVQAPNRYRKRGQTPASYLAKYVTKGIEPAEFSGRKAGELLVAFRGRRKVSTSRTFWLREDHTCRACGAMHRMLDAPCSLQDIAPAAVLRSMAERTRYRDVSRFELQMRLLGPDDTPLV